MRRLIIGFLYGVAFFIPGFYLFTYGKLPDVSYYMATLRELPVVQHLSDRFQTEFDLNNADFNKGLQQFLADYNNGKLFTSTSLHTNASWAWHRADIEAKLKQELGNRKLHRQQLFLDYIQRYAPLALSEMAQSRVPASVTLAQGILETSAGESRLARIGHNHFGIKCYVKSDFRADGVIDHQDFSHHALAYDCMQMKDDNVWDRFHMYETDALSYRHHSLLLTREPRYNWMIQQYSGKIGQKCQVEGAWFGTDWVPYYAAWCIGLKKSGYATNPKYAQKLTYIIETYELWRFDYQVIMFRSAE